jgi:hypothetical protein
MVAPGGRTPLRNGVVVAPMSRTWRAIWITAHTPTNTRLGRRSLVSRDRTNADVEPPGGDAPGTSPDSRSRRRRRRSASPGGTRWRSTTTASGPWRWCSRSPRPPSRRPRSANGRPPPGWRAPGGNRRIGPAWRCAGHQLVQPAGHVQVSVGTAARSSGYSGRRDRPARSHHVLRRDVHA